MRKLGPLCLALALLVTFSAAARAQQRRITGQVVAADTKEPLPSSAVTIGNTSTGTATDDQGRFSLTLPAPSATLRVRRIGYKAQTVTVPADQSEITITLERDVLLLEAQVVTGQGLTVSRQNAANSTALLSSEQVNRTSTQTIENAMQGKIAGATIVSNSGAPGGGMQVRMRGATSILGNSDPLYVVDGVIVSNDVIQPGTNAVLGAAGGANASSQDNGVNRIADLNPSDIESIEVLKGASASAIYGGQASNGVILITTKRGAGGKPRLNLTQRVGTFALAKKLGQLRFNSVEDAIAWDAENGAGLPEDVIRADYAACNGYCDHEQQLYGRKPLSYETNLSVSGGNDVTRYFASGLVQRDGGIAPNTGYDKQSLRLNLSQQVASKLNLQVNTNLVHSRTARGLSNNDNANITPYFVFPVTPSYFDLRPKNGIYPENPFTSSNPLQTYAYVRTPDEVYRFVGSVSGTYSLMNSERQSLDLRADGGVDRLGEKVNIISPRGLQYEPLDGLDGTATDLNADVLNANASIGLTHSYTPASTPLKLTTAVGAQRFYHQLSSANAVGLGMIGGQDNLGNAAAVQLFDLRDKSQTLAFYGTEDILAFDERLFVTVGLRAEKSTTNGDANKLYYYPKAAASYRLPVLTSVLEEFKVRAAFGQAGNPPLSASRYTPLIVGVYDGQNSVQAGARFGNPNAKPERQTEIEGGFDLVFLQSRASLSVSGYQKTITDLLLRPALAPSRGVTNEDIQTGAKMRNRGAEIELGITPVQSSTFSWVTRTTFAKNVGKVLSLPEAVGHVACLNAARTAVETDQSKCPRGFTAGAFGFFYGQGRVEEGASPTQIIGQDTLPGGKTYLRKFGDTEPDFSIGFSNQFTYKGFRVHALLDWRKGASIVNLTQSVYDDVGSWADTAGARRRGDAAGAGVSPYIQDASFVKLREVAVSYDLPTSWTSRVFGGGVRSATLELSGRNLVTWTKYEGIDPEVSNFGNQNIVRNQDLAPFPPSRSFFFSLNLGF